jgi:hypothetical protein
MIDPVLPAPTADIAAEINEFIPESIRRRLAERARSWHGARMPELPERAGRPGKIACKARMPGRRRARAIRPVCGAVRVIAGEIVFLIGGRAPDGRNRRFAMSHVQQIAMYVCHVVLQLTMTDIAAAFGRDRTTVGHACARVEDRRDDKAYDTLVASIERVVDCIFGRTGSRS